MAPEAVAEAYHAFEQGSQVSPLSAAAVSNQTIQESQRLLLLVRAYQVRCCSQAAWLPVHRALHQVRRCVSFAESPCSELQVVPRTACACKAVVSMVRSEGCLAAWLKVTPGV